jgi:hypothetical protein
VIESNSTDESKAVLEKHTARVSWMHFESISSPDAIFPHRTQKLAHARNKYLEVFSQLNENKDIELLVVCDLNNLNKKITIESVRSCDKITEWGALTANQDGPYYDIWALRHQYWNVGDCWEQYNELTEFYPNDKLALWDSVYSKMIVISSQNAPILVNSAFGGLAIYKVKYLEDCEYIGVNDKKSATCEHVSFNAKFRENGGAIYINPSLINLKFTDHSLRKKYFLLFNMKYKLRKIFQ